MSYAIVDIVVNIIDEALEKLNQQMFNSSDFFSF